MLGESNAGLVVGDGASLLVDTLWDLPLTRRMLAAIAPLTAKAPVETLVNSHSNGTMRPNGSDVQQLTFNDAPVDEGPNWSPDGRMIAFDSDRDRTEETPFQTEIYTMRADGDDQTRLTFDDLSDFYPAWSPDGRQIAFSSFREATEENEGNCEIFTMRPDGSDLVNRTNNPAFDAAPDWQPLDADDDQDDDDDKGDDD